MININDNGAVKDVKYQSLKIGIAYLDEDGQYVFKSHKNRVWTEKMLFDLSKILNNLNKKP